jgi:hypothetical protein
MSGIGDLIADRVRAAPGSTVAAGTARLFGAWSTVSPVPQERDRRCEGVADFAARRARVSQVLVPEGMAAALAANEDDAALREFSEPKEMVYDGANAYMRVAGRWTGFFLGDPGGPRGPNDPLWPLDALFGANDDAVEIGPESVRGVTATRCRLTVDLGRADAAVAAGISVPAGPYRALSRMPAEVWLDEAGLVRRIAVRAEPVTGASGVQTWAIAELWDFGVAADITPPQPGEVVPPREAYRDLPGPA